MNYTDKQIKLLLEAVYEGRITQYELPEDLYFAIANYLKKGLYEGFGGTLDDFDGQDLELLTELRTNTYMFSAAKTFQQVGHFESIIAETKTFKDFFEQARKVYDQYNEDWAKAEYNTAIGQAQQAAQWNQFEKEQEQFPYLRYVAVLDKNTSEICKPLNGIIAPVNSSLWNKYSPLNHFNCRCVLEKLSKYDNVKSSSESRVSKITKELDETVQPEFKMNPGKDGYIFSPKHPYFEVAKKDKPFAKRNFDLPIPEKD